MSEGNMKAQLLALQQALEDAQSNEKKACDKLEARQKEFEAFEKTIKQQEARIALLDDTCRKAEKTGEDLQQARIQIGIQMHTISSMSKREKEDQEMMKTLTSRVDKLTSDKSALELEKSLLAGRMDTAQARVDQQHNMVQDLQKRLGNTEKKLEGSEKKLDDTRKQLDDTRKQLENTAGELHAQNELAGRRERAVADANSVRIQNEHLHQNLDDMLAHFTILSHGLSRAPQSHFSWLPLFTAIQSATKMIAEDVTLPTTWRMLTPWSKAVGDSGGGGCWPLPVDSNGTPLALRLWGQALHAESESLGSQETLLLLSHLAHVANHAKAAQPLVLSLVLDKALESIRTIQKTVWKRADCYLYAACIVAGVAISVIKTRWPVGLHRSKLHSAEKSLYICLDDKERCAPIIKDVLEALVAGPAAVQTLGKEKGLYYEDRGLVLIGDGCRRPARDFLLISTKKGDCWTRCVSAVRVTQHGEFDLDETKQVGRIRAPPEDASLELPSSTIAQDVWFLRNQAVMDE